jgi:lactobin A/cerein 7B family class IIb bacteriocin
MNATTNIVKGPRELTVDEVNQIDGGCAIAIAAALIVGAAFAAGCHLAGWHSDYNPACMILD